MAGWNGNLDNVDLDFTYDDADAQPSEVAELYSYTEESEFWLNKNAFEQLMEDNGFPLRWIDMTSSQRQRTLSLIAETLELSVKQSRMAGVRAVLYMAQGNFGECLTLHEQARLARDNVFELYKQGFFSTMIQLLLMEIEEVLIFNSSAAASQRKSPSNLSDSVDMRTILDILYLFVEMIRVRHDDEDEEYESLREQLTEELSNPINDTNDLLAIILFQMATKFCNGSAPQFPIKKVLLLLWKVILVSLGGIETLRSLKNTYRHEGGLPPVPDDSIEVTKTMRASSPPASAAEIMEAQNQRKLNRPFRRQMIVKQPSLGNSDDQDAEVSDEVDAAALDDQNTADAELRKNVPQEEKVDIGARPASPRPSNAGLQNLPPHLAASSGNGEGFPSLPIINKGLPWSPKVRQRDLDTFFDHTRCKFVGFLLPGDRTTSAGLPGPILEGIKILQNHMYISLTELQIKKEEELMKYPLTVKEDHLQSLQSSTEQLYQAMLPSLSQYMIALLKILLAAAPTSKAKTESINVMSEMLPEEMPSGVVPSMKLTIDVNRHKEIIIKAVSAILLLLLKHYKINHVYQFEYISQQLMFANCIPLVLKFFNQNICQYISAKTSISVIDFPACVIGEQPELTLEVLEMSEGLPYVWRNMFSCINLLRILNKLTKWKHSRIMMLVVFKSAPILKRALKVRQAMLQLYVLKLLKMQAKYLGRQWRKSNMKTMSAIYQKVRHRITDDWAYGNDLDARPWDFQAEEFALQASINRFHYRRYGKSGNPGVAQHAPQPPAGSSQPNYNMDGAFNELDLMQCVDTNVISVLNAEIELTPEFKRNYEQWLEREVFQFHVDWDQLLSSTNTSDM